MLVVLASALVSPEVLAADESPACSDTQLAQELLSAPSVGNLVFDSARQSYVAVLHQQGISEVWQIGEAAGESAAKRELLFSYHGVLHLLAVNEYGYLYARDQDGDELVRLIFRDRSGAERYVAPPTGAPSVLLRMSNDRRIAYAVVPAREPVLGDIWAYDTKTGISEPIYRARFAQDVESLSGDGKELLVTRARGNQLVEIWQSATSDPSQLHHLATVASGASEARFDLANQNIFYERYDPLGDRASPIQTVVRQNLQTGEVKEVASAEGSVRAYAVGATGEFLAIGRAVGSRSVWSIHHLESGSTIEMPDFGTEHIQSLTFLDGDKKVAAHLIGDRAPGTWRVWPIDAPEQIQTILDTERPTRCGIELSEGKDITFPSEDGEPIPAILYVPRPEVKVLGGIVQAHGGPGEAFVHYYDPETQALVERGYVVVKVNNRGSIGYNHRFYHLDDHGHGTKDLQDIVAAGDLLVSKYGVPRSQLAVMGGSYGGYLVLAALAFRSEAFAAGIDVFGVTDWVTTLDNMPPWWIGYREYFHTEIGHPTLDRAHLREISPAYFPEKIQRPLMVVQGANDPRVRAEWSDALVSSLREHGRSVEYLYFPDEGHGFSKPANRQTLIVRALSFLARVFADSAPAR